MDSITDKVKTKKKDNKKKHSYPYIRNFAKHRNYKGTADTCKDANEDVRHSVATKHDKTFLSVNAARLIGHYYIFRI